MKVLIDPGHAPGNANGSKNGYKEYEGMWKLSNFLKEVLTASGVSAVLTRTENADPPLEMRGSMAKSYDLFISEHSNAANGTARGVECFYSIAKPNDKIIAAKLSAIVSTLMCNPDRRAKTRVSDSGKDYYGVIRAAIATGCPHVFLIENGFHDNTLDEKFLLKDENLKKVAEAQAKVILEALGVPSVPKADNTKTPIMGASILTVEQLAAFLLLKNPEPKINCSALELARFFIEEGNIEGVRGDIAFCQSLHETGWFRYSGDVKPEQNNFSGIGTVGGGAKGAYFKTPQEGVRAQTQHLKAYASKEPLKQECVDPRFSLVNRGVASNWEDLNGRWAVPGTTYGQSILNLYYSAREFAAMNPPWDSTPLRDVEKAIDILVKHGVINSPDYWLANYEKLKYVDSLITNMAKKLIV